MLIFGCSINPSVKVDPTLKINDEPKVEESWLEIKKSPEYPNLHPIVIEKDGTKWTCFNPEDNKKLGKYVVSLEADNAFYKEEIKTTYFKLFKKKLEEK